MVAAQSIEHNKRLIVINISVYYCVNIIYIVFTKVRNIALVTMFFNRFLAITLKKARVLSPQILFIQAHKQ